MVMTGKVGKPHPPLVAWQL